MRMIILDWLIIRFKNRTMNFDVIWSPKLQLWKPTSLALSLGICPEAAFGLSQKADTQHEDGLKFCDDLINQSQLVPGGVRNPRPQR